MSPIALGSTIGAAALTVGRGAVNTISQTASFASELITPGEASTAAQQRQSQHSDARAALKQRTDELTQRIQQRLAGAGVQLSQPVELISDGQGGIAVATDDPQSAAIQAVLSSDILLERDFAMLAGDYEEFIQSTATTDMPPTLVLNLPKKT